MKKFAVIAAVLVLILVVLFAGCTGQEKDQGDKIKFGVLPIVDNLPFWVAQERGYFAEEGVDVELVPFDSAMVRDSAIASKQIDGALGDVVALASLNNGGTPVKAVAVGQGVTPEEGRFALLVAPGSDITSPQQLKNVGIAVSLNTIVEYVTDKLLQDQGLKPEEIKKISMPNIQARLEALLAGKIQAAVLPDPPAAVAELKGARLILDDTSQNLSQTVIFFRKDVLEDRKEEVKKLLKAYTRAVEDIQDQPEAFNDLLIEKARVPREVLEQIDNTGMKIKFSKPELPARKDVMEVVEWMRERGLLKKDLTYSELVSEEVLR